jgi:hypothetical protein
VPAAQNRQRRQRRVGRIICFPQIVEIESALLVFDMALIAVF